jgi:predicted dehydrogenase
MTCILIGQGYFGKILKDKIENLCLRLITIDPFVETADFKTYEQIDHIYTTSETFWFIATPPKTHKNIAVDIITNYNARRIWIEKPICKTLEDTIELDKIIKYNNVYIYPDFTWLQTNICIKIRDSIQRESSIPVFFKMTMSCPHSHVDYINGDVSLILDIIPHPLSILHMIMKYTKDEITSISEHYHTIDRVDIVGTTKNKLSFLFEIDNASEYKNRSITFHTTKSSIMWNSEIKDDGIDAITRHLQLYLNLEEPIINYLDVAATTEILCKK